MIRRRIKWCICQWTWW